MRGRFGLGVDDAVVLVQVAGYGYELSSQIALQLSLVLGGVGAIIAGFAVLRAPVALGPLDRLRELALFSAARTVPLRVLLTLAALRCTMVGSFILSLP